MANNSSNKGKNAKTTYNKSTSRRSKSTEQGIVNVVKNECCPSQANNPAQVQNSTSAYSKLAKNASRFDVK